MQPSTKLWGVNVAGAEFGSALPGVHGTDYVYPDPANGYNTFVYFAAKKQNVVRVPIQWERLQPTFSGPLAENDLAGLKLVLDAAQIANQAVILDLHNYARYYNDPLRVTDAPHLADFWRKLANRLKGHPALNGYELMNEPHDLPDGTAGWASIAQTVTNAIREVDQQHTIFIPGCGWQTATFWRDNNENLRITDSANKLVYTAHLYFDADHTGRYNGGGTASYNNGAYPTIGVDRVRPFLQWLDATGSKGMLTEYGIPAEDSRWLAVLINFLREIAAHPRITGGQYWAAGPWWGDYALSVEPVGTQDKPQIAVLLAIVDS